MPYFPWKCDECERLGPRIDGTLPPSPDWDLFELHIYMKHQGELPGLLGITAEEYAEPRYSAKRQDRIEELTKRTGM